MRTKLIYHFHLEYITFLNNYDFEWINELYQSSMIVVSLYHIVTAKGE